MFGIFKSKKNDKVLRIRVSPYYLTDIDKNLKILKKVLSPTDEEFSVISWTIKADSHFSVYVSREEHTALEKLLSEKMCIQLKRYMQRDEGDDRALQT